MKVSNFYLLRHGKVEGEPALNGHTDKKVDAQIQASICQALSCQNIEFDQIISSPLRRCSDLLPLLQQQYPNVDTELNENFQELSFGELDGRPFETIKDKWPLLDAFWEDPANNPLPKSELLSDFNQRIVSAWSKQLEAENKNTLIITHGGVIRMLLAHALQVDWKNPAWHSNLSIGNASLTHIQVSKTDQYYINVKSIAQALLP